MAKLATQTNISSMTPLRTRHFGSSFGVSVTPDGPFGPHAAPTMRTKLAHEKLNKKGSHFKPTCGLRAFLPFRISLLPILASLPFQSLRI